MTCAGPRLLPEVVRKSSGAFMCPVTQKAAVAGTQRRCRRRRQGKSKGSKCLVMRYPPGAVDQTGCTERFTRNTTISSTSLPGVRLVRLREASAVAPAEKAAAVRGPTSFTNGTKTQFGSRSTGAIPAIPSLSSTAVAGHISPGTRTSLKSAAFDITASTTLNEKGLEQSGHCFPVSDRCDAGGNRHLRKQRRGNRDGRSSGPVKIWCCPTTSSLREEACADLAGMAKPGLWRTNAHPPWEQHPGCVELERLKERFKADRKRRAAGVKLKLDFLSFLRAEMSEEVRERWMQRRALMRADRFTVEQRRELREWFDCLDRDGSGEIDCSELSHPLLCTGLARSALEVGYLVKQVDKDGSGEIGFKEFLAIFQPKEETAAKSVIDKIVHLQEVKKAHGSDMQTVVATERRSLLIKEVLDEAAFRTSVAEEVAQQRCIAESNGDIVALRALIEKEARLERRRLKKNLFIQAVSDATDFKQERERLRDTTLQEANRRRQILKTRALAASVGFLLPSRSSLKLNANDGTASLTVSFSEPELVTTSRLSSRNLGGSTTKVGLETGQASGNNVSGGATTINSAAADALRGSEAHNLLEREEQRLLQRRGHHHNFKKSASARNLAGTCGMSGTGSSSPRLGGGEENGCDGGGGGDIHGAGLGESTAGTVAPVTVTASVRVYSAGGIMKSPSPPGEEMTGMLDSPFLSGVEERETNRSPLPRGEACNRRGSGGSSGHGSPPSVQGKRDSRENVRSVSRQSGVDNGFGSASGDHLAEEGDAPHLGDSGRHGLPLAVDPSCLSGHDSTKFTAAKVAGPVAMVTTVPATVGTSVAEKDCPALTARPPSSDRGRAKPVGVKNTGVASGMGGMTTSPRKDTAMDWYRHSKLSAVATSTLKSGDRGKPRK